MGGLQRLDAVVSGIGQSDVARRLHRQPLDLTIDACLDAIADAGLTTADIDGVSTAVLRAFSRRFKHSQAFIAAELVGARAMAAQCQWVAESLHFCALLLQEGGKRASIFVSSRAIRAPG